MIKHVHTDNGGEERRFVERQLRDLTRYLFRADRRLERARQVLAHNAAQNRQRVAHYKDRNSILVLVHVYGHAGIRCAKMIAEDVDVIAMYSYKVEAHHR